MLRKFFGNKKGQGLVEYGLIIAGVALICAAAVLAGSVFRFNHMSIFAKFDSFFSSFALSSSPSSRSPRSVIYARAKSLIRCRSRSRYWHWRVA